MNKRALGKYQAYPEYKDSGVEWLGDVPSHWNAKPLKFLCTCNDDVISDSTSKEFELEYVDIGSVTASYGITRTELMLFGKAPSRARRMVRDGDVIVSTVRTYLEAIAPINNPPKSMVVSTGFAVIRPSMELFKGYAAYCLRASGFIKEVIARSVGVSYPAINASDLIDIKIPNLPYIEQIQIANFLDHETAKIDTLIDKQQQLIKLLKEKRQAVISHAVTKGLNPDAPMKDSGVDWLGEVPEHWEKIPLKYISQIRYGIGEPPKYMEIGTPLIRATNIRSGKVSEINIAFVNPEDIPSQRIVWLKEGDIIVVRSGAGTGDSSIIPIAYDGSIAGFDMVVTPKKCIPNFLAHALLSNYIRNNQIDLEKTRAAQPHLNAEELGDCFVLLPPGSEQSLISHYIDKASFKFDVLMDKATHTIHLMQERRTALISAAVTGKIDVRYPVSPPTGNAENEHLEPTI